MTGAPIVADEPAWPAVQVVREQGEAPDYYTKPKPIVGIGARPSIKGLARVGDAGDRAGAAFGFDAHAVGRIGFGRARRTFGLWPEAGYVFSGADGHFASVGIGPASQSPTPWLQPFPDGFSFGVVPHLLLGVRDGRGAIGLRTSAIGEVYFDDGNAWGVEVSHQITRFGPTTLHEIVFGVSLTWMFTRWKR